MKNKKKGKFGMISVAVAAVIIVVLLNFAAIKFVQNSITGNAIKEGGQTQLVIAERISSILESEVHNLENDLEVLSKFKDVMGNDVEKCSKKLEEVSSIYSPKMESLIRLNENGIISCAADMGMIGTDRSMLPHIKKIFLDEKHSPVISDFGKSLSAGKWSVAVHVPVYDDNGKFSGTAGGRIIFSEIASDYLQNITSFGGTRLIILDADGDIAYYSNNPDITGKNWWSKEIQDEFGGNEDFNNIVKDSAWGKSGSGKATFLKTENIVSYATADVFAGKKWSVIIASPTRNIVSESAGEPTAFVLLYAGSALAVVVITGVALTLMSRVAKYVIEDLAEKIVENKNRKRRKR